MEHKQSHRRAALILVSIISAVLLFVIAAGAIGIPDEDAAILYNYSKNLADTGVISYVAGGERAEGATDFGWMISIAILQKVGISNHIGSGLLNSLFLALLAYRFWTIRKTLKLEVTSLNPLIAFCSVLVIIFCSGISISGFGGFSTLAQMCLLGIIFASSLFRLYDRLFLASSVYYVLLRPDSIAYYLVIVAPFLLFELVGDRPGDDSDHTIKFEAGLPKLYYPGRNRKRTKQRPASAHLRTAAIPALIFTLYWASRALYFQRAFPLPYYVKQSQDSDLISLARRLPAELTSNGYNHLSATIVLAIGLLLCCCRLLSAKNRNRLDQSGIASSSQQTNSEATAMASSSRTQQLTFWLAGFFTWLCFYIYQSLYLSRFNLIQNVWDRFHAPLLGVSAAFLGCFLLIYVKQSPLNNGRNIGSLLPLGTLVLILVSIQANIKLKSVATGYVEYFRLRFDNNIYPLSLDLRTVNTKKNLRSMFVTEAGRLSYYSGIPSVDTWGLNTPEFSQAPLQDASYVVSKKPDLISMHVDFTRLTLKHERKSLLEVGRNCAKSGDTVDDGYCGWHQMNQAIFNGARSLGYDMYLVPYTKSAGPNDRYDLFMVYPKSPAADELKKALLSNKAIAIKNPEVLKHYKF